MPDLQLGKLPATADRRDLMFSRYVRPAAVPALPDQFGHETLIPGKGWGVLGNDEWRDCAWAGSAHETMLLTAEANAEVAFTTQGVLSDYAADTGFQIGAGPPGGNATDKGSNVRDVYKYRAKKGILDATGKRHTIGAYVKVDQTNLDEIYQALYIFQVVGVGLNFPVSAMFQFHAGDPWDVMPDSPIDGGHYVCMVAKRANLEVVTWGVIQQMTVAFFKAYCDEAWAYVTSEALAGGKDIQGFDLAQLKADLAAL